MISEEFIDNLLRAPDTQSRRVLLDTHFEFVKIETIYILKTHADRLERDDAHLALNISRVADEIAELLSDDEARALALWMKANAHDLLSELETAVRCYERAAELFNTAGKPLEAARTSIGLMSTLMKMGQFDQVQASAELARPVFIRQGDVLSLAKIEMNLGALHYQQGRYSLARDDFKRAAEAFQSLGDSLYAAMNQINQAASMTMLDDFMGAEQLHEQARPVFEKAELRSVAGSVDHDLAFLKYARGSYTDAFRTFELARDIFVGLSDKVNIAKTDLEESDLNLDLNLPEAALRLAENAENAFREMGMPFEQARARVNHAVALARLGQSDLAANFLEAARSLFVSQGNEAWMAHTDLQRAEIIGQDNLRREQARLLAAEALKIYEKLEMKTKQAYAHIVSSNLWADDSRWQQALLELENARSTIKNIAAPWLEQRIEVCSGRVYEGMEQPERSIEHYQKAAEKTEQMTAAITAEEHRTAFVADKLAPYEALVRLYARRDPSIAFKWAEQAKSRALVDLLAAGVRPRLHLNDETDIRRIERLQELREELNWLYSRLTRGTSPGESGAPAAGPETWDKIQDREQEATTLFRELQVRHPETLSLIRGVSLSSTDIQTSLPAETALVEYFISYGQVTVFVITKEKILVYPAMVTIDDLLPLMESLAFQFSKFQYGPAYFQRHRGTLLKGTQEILAQLGQKLIGLFQKELSPVKAIIFIPHGPLHSLPFHALRVDDQYLIEKYTISYAPSAAVMKFCRDKPVLTGIRSPFQGKPLLVGVPDERASHVTEEIQALGKLLSEAEILLGGQATFEQVCRSSKDSGVFHLAAHGLFRPEAPLLSSIHLADRWLAVQDIYDLDLKASLVTLSACETGLGHDAGGDDMVGLVRGFLHAGASSLLVSLWMVDDESMTHLMTGFYTEWLAGSPKAQALRQAQLALMKVYEHPYFWAPLALVGNER